MNPQSTTNLLDRKIKTSVGQETPAETLARARNMPRPEVSSVTNPEGAVNASTLRSGGTPDIPEPTAQNVAESFQGGLQASTEAARTNLDTTLKTERDAALKREDDLNKKQEKLVQDSNPENSETFQQEQRIVQNQLDATETASATMEEDFNKRRSVVNELETVLTQGNQLIEQARGAPISRYRNAGVAEAMQNVQARAGVLNAVISGLDGNINAAHSIINNTRTAVAAQWTDQLNYNKTYRDLVSSGQLAKNKINDDYASTQITLAERKLSQLEATAETINNLMIDPESAQFMADAGITLNDSVEEINAKMSEQTKVQERQDVMNELKKEGYEYVPFPGDREDVVSLEVGGKTLSFVAPVDEMEELRKEKLQADIDKVRGSGSGGGGFTAQETRKLEQAGLVGAPRQEQLDFLYGGSGAKVDITPAQERTLVGVGFAGEDIAQIQQDVADFGLDTVLEGIDNEQQRTEVSEIFGREVKSEPATVDEIKTKITTTLSGIKDVYTRGEAEDLARTNLESALGTKNLPATFENAIQDALVDVYGRTFWQSITPGGR